ncbi:MAG: hypothetical protein ABEJ72_08560, partial [Candidatus Aenigmatarchaeota archaeon]
MRPLLSRISDIQIRKTNLLLVVAVAVTLVLSMGIPRITLQTNFQESLPDDLAPIKTQEKIENKFGNLNSIIVLFKINDKAKEESYITDVRDPRLIESMEFLSKELNRETLVSSTFSLASLFPQVPENKKKVKKVLENVNRPGLTNRDFTASLMYVRLSEESTEEKIRKATKMINENIRETPMY